MRYLIIVAALAVAGCDEPPFNPSMDGIRDAARRHDALARRKYAKPFKWFKFNRARRATAK